MLFTAFLSGVALGVAFDLLTALQLALGVFDTPPYMLRLYERPLPLLGRCVALPRTKKGYRARRAAVLFVGDFFFCLAVGAVLILIFFAFNSGRVRLSVPPVLFLGLAAWRVTGARASTRLLGVVAFAFGVAATYLGAALALPVKGIHRLLGGAHSRLRLARARANKRRKEKRAAAAASARQSAACVRKEGQANGKKNGTIKRHATGHSNSRRGHILPLHRHLRGQNDRGQSPAPSGRGAAAAKGRARWRE